MTISTWRTNLRERENWFQERMMEIGSENVILSFLFTINSYQNKACHFSLINAHHEDISTLFSFSLFQSLTQISYTNTHLSYLSFLSYLISHSLSFMLQASIFI